MSKKKLYQVDIMLCGTVYVKATSVEQALSKAKEFSNDSFEVDGELVSRLRFDDPRLPDISLSPAMTGCGIWPNSTIGLA